MSASLGGAMMRRSSSLPVPSSVPMPRTSDGGGSAAGGPPPLTHRSSFTAELAAIGDMDPSLADGARIFYEREVPIELRVVEDASDTPKEVGSMESLRVKILILGDEAEPISMRMEVTTESDLFFHYSHSLDAAGFAQIQDSQKLMVEYPDYPTMLGRMLNRCIKEPQVYLAVFVVQANGGPARLDFIQNMEYKFVELLSCTFTASSKEVVHQQIAFRYSFLKARVAMMQARLADVNNIVKMKNPSLFLQLDKTLPRVLPQPRKLL